MFSGAGGISPMSALAPLVPILGWLLTVSSYCALLGLAPIALKVNVGWLSELMSNGEFLLVGSSPKKDPVLSSSFCRNRLKIYLQLECMKQLSVCLNSLYPLENFLQLYLFLYYSDNNHNYAHYSLLFYWLCDASNGVSGMPSIRIQNINIFGLPLPKVVKKCFFYMPCKSNVVKLVNLLEQWRPEQPIDQLTEYKVTWALVSTLHPWTFMSYLDLVLPTVEAARGGQSA